MTFVTIYAKLGVVSSVVALKTTNKIHTTKNMNPASETVPLHRKKINCYRQRFKTREQRFWEYVKKTDTCWIWTGTRYGSGYGRLETKGVVTPAHHLSYNMHIGEIESGKLVCHSCDNPSCVNPAHLWLGTPKENTQDMLKKGRTNQPKGAKHWATKLTEEKVLEIRRIYAEGILTQQQIGDIFGVDNNCIQKIVNRTRWTHI